MDILTQNERKKRMQLIKSKDSKVELIVFAFLRSKNIYFQKHYSKAPGKPDIALPRKKMAVFIDGDFWHGRDHERTKRGRDEDDYWAKKIAYNMKRDLEQEKILKQDGWGILRVWESDIKRKRTQGIALQNIILFLSQPNAQSR